MKFALPYPLVAHLNPARMAHIIVENAPFMVYYEVDADEGITFIDAVKLGGTWFSTEVFDQKFLEAMNAVLEKTHE